MRACGFRGLEGLGARGPEGPVRPFVWGVCVRLCGASASGARAPSWSWGAGEWVSGAQV